jgi:hypothetical protein
MTMRWMDIVERGRHVAPQSPQCPRRDEEPPDLVAVVNSDGGLHPRCRNASLNVVMRFSLESGGIRSCTHCGVAECQEPHTSQLHDQNSPGKKYTQGMNEETESIVRCRIFIPAINIRPYWPRNSVPRSCEDAGRGVVDGGVECGLAAPVHLDPATYAGTGCLGRQWVETRRIGVLDGDHNALEGSKDAVK